MLEINKFENWFIVNKKIYLSENWLDSKYINLHLSLKKDIMYWNNEFNIINFPWEYEIMGTLINCFDSKDGLLNYMIEEWNDKFIFIQDYNILKELTIEWTSFICYKWENSKEIENSLDVLEYIWKKINLDELP